MTKKTILVIEDNPDNMTVVTWLLEDAGFSIATAIRADKTLKTIPVIGLSAHAMANDREVALAAGCDEYQTKPINEISLLKTINNFI